jgi:hypothetical protein
MHDHEYSCSLQNCHFTALVWCDMCSAVLLQTFILQATYSIPPGVHRFITSTQAREYHGIMGQGFNRWSRWCFHVLLHDQSSTQQWFISKSHNSSGKSQSLSLTQRLRPLGHPIVSDRDGIRTRALSNCGLTRM